MLVLYVIVIIIICIIFTANKYHLLEQSMSFYCLSPSREGVKQRRTKEADYLFYCIQTLNVAKKRLESSQVP